MSLHDSPSDDPVKMKDLARLEQEMSSTLNVTFIGQCCDGDV